MVSIKLECWSSGVAHELAKFIEQCGWATAVLGTAVLSDMPGQYAGPYCNAMIKIGTLSENDFNVKLGH